MVDGVAGRAPARRVHDSPDEWLIDSVYWAALTVSGTLPGLLFPTSPSKARHH
jgi:hypothetical protein